MERRSEHPRKRGVEILAAQLHSHALSNASLPDELNHIYGCFDRDNKEVAIKTLLPVDH